MAIGKIIKLSVVLILILSLVSLGAVVRLFLIEKAKRIKVESILKTTEDAKEQVEKELDQTNQQKNS